MNFFHLQSFNIFHIQLKMTDLFCILCFQFYTRINLFNFLYFIYLLFILDHIFHDWYTILIYYRIELNNIANILFANTNHQLVEIFSIRNIYKQKIPFLLSFSRYGVSIYNIDIIANYQNTSLQYILNSKNQKILVFMDILTLVVTIIGSILCVLVDIYFIIIYTHKQQPLFRPLSIFCKILILITLLQVQLQPLFLLFDVNSSRVSGTNFTILWFVVYFSILVNVAFLKPLASSLYEADEDDPCWKIVLWSVIEVIITMGVFGVFLGVGWIFWAKAYLPVTIITVSDIYDPAAAISQEISYEYIQMTATFPCFLIAILCLIGYPILACCGAVGMTALPFSLIKDFNNRPKWRRTQQAKAIALQMQKQTVSLIKQADRLRRLANKQQTGWFSRKNKQLQSNITEIQTKLQKHRDFYQLFKLQLHMDKVNPWIFILKLAGGIICLIFTPLWLVQILLAQLVFDKSVFIDKFLVLMEQNGASFISVIFIFILTMYMIFATIKGIFFVSEYLPFFKIHPIVEGKTWLNSFMFQTNLAVIASTALIHLMITTFPEYLRGGDIALMMGQIISRMLFVGVLLTKKVFIYIFLIMSVLGALFTGFSMFCLNHKSQQMLKIEDLRKKLFGKKEKNKQINIQMTQINLHDKDKDKDKDKQKQHKSSKKDIKQKNKRIKVEHLDGKSSKTKIKLEFM